MEPVSETPTEATDYAAISAVYGTLLAGVAATARGREPRYAVGELLECTRCTGAWSSLALVALRLHAPAAGRVVTAVLAASAGNDLLHTGFSLLCAKANAAHGDEARTGE